MNKTLLAFIAIVGIGILGLGIGGIYVLNLCNTAGTLQNSYNMKVKANEADFDNLYKQIAQSVQLPAAKKEAFKEIFTSYASARTNQSQNQLMTWIKESAPPQPDLSIYDKVLNIITGQRDSWTFRQKELVGIAEDYNRPFYTTPSKQILGLFGYQIIDPKVITSTRTEQAFQTGKDDEIDLKLK